jgi:hypothetical protein
MHPTAPTAEARATRLAALEAAARHRGARDQGEGVHLAGPSQAGRAVPEATDNPLLSMPVAFIAHCSEWPGRRERMGLPGTQGVASYMTFPRVHGITSQGVTPSPTPAAPVPEIRCLFVPPIGL